MTTGTRPAMPGLRGCTALPLTSRRSTAAAQQSEWPTCSVGGLREGDLPPGSQLSEERLIEVLRVPQHAARSLPPAVPRGSAGPRLHRGVLSASRRGGPGRPLPAPARDRVRRRQVATTSTRTCCSGLYDDVAAAESAAGGATGWRSAPPTCSSTAIWWRWPRSPGSTRCRAAARRAASGVPRRVQPPAPARDVRRSQPRAGRSPCRGGVRARGEGAGGVPRRLSCRTARRHTSPRADARCRPSHPIRGEG